MRIKTLFAICFVVLFCARTGLAEPPTGDDPLARFLFPPEKVLGHAQELGLDDAQRKNIKAELQTAQSRFLDAHLEMQPEEEKMAQLLQEKPADERKVLAQADKLMSLEREVKKAHLSLLVRIKNILTPAQQTRMSEIQRAEGK